MRDPDGNRIEIDSFDRVDYETPEEGVARVTLNRPEVKNAQDVRMIAELEEAFKKAEADDDVRCLILRGAGSDFSTGHDLEGWSQDESDHGVDLEKQWWKAWNASVESREELEEEWFFDHVMELRDLAIPTIASVEGHCILAGVMLADVCDLIVASTDARFWVPSLRHVGGAAEVQTLPWSIGVRKTKEMLWTGDPLYAEDAKELGMVNRVVPADELADETLYLARRIALMPEVALRITKKSLNNMLDEMGYRDSQKYHFALHQIIHASEQSEQWHEEATKRREDGDLSDWLQYRDEPFEKLADEYGKDDPKIS